MNGEMQDRRADSPHDRAAASVTFGRRRFMTRGCACAATLAFALAGRRFAPYGLGIAQAWGAAPPDNGYRAFMALSQRLTGRTRFDAVLGQRIYSALVMANSQFEHNVRALNRWLQGHGGVPSDVVTAALKPELPELAATVSDVVRAWYLGLIGEAPNVRVLAYEKALMFDAVDDVLTIPSYCRDLPFYWTLKPPDFAVPTASLD
jgi:fructose 5-dehydrogenase small subunit